MNDILIVAVVTMISCLIINIASLFYKANEIRKIEVKLKKLEEKYNVIIQGCMNGCYNTLLKIHGDDCK